MPMPTAKKEEPSWLVAISQNIIASVIWAIGSAALPSIVTVCAIVFGRFYDPIKVFIDSFWFGASIACIWSINLLSLYIWYRDHAKKVGTKVLTLAQLNYVSHQLSRRFLFQNTIVVEEELDRGISSILEKMCEIFAYRLDKYSKGATFLGTNGLVDPKNNDATPYYNFKLLASFNHDEARLLKSVEVAISTEGSMANEAIRRMRIVEVRDSDKSNAYYWIPGTAEDGFRYHVAYPVVADFMGRRDVVGVLCFDIKKPWRLQHEEAELLVVFARSIGILWANAQISANNKRRSTHKGASS